MQLNVSRQEYSAWNIHYVRRDHRSDRTMRVSSTRYGSHSEMSREKAAPSAEVTTEVRAIAEMASEVRDSLMRLRALHWM